MGNISYTKSNSSMQTDILKLHSDVLKEIGDASIDDLTNSIDKELCTVATDDNTIIGYCSILPYSDCPNSQENIKSALMFRSQMWKNLLINNILTRNQQQNGGEIIVEYFENKIAQKYSLEPCDNDLHCVALGVNENYRRKGIGITLLDKTIEYAKSTSANNLFTECWNKKNSQRLYEKAGFLPFLNAGPSYPDGSPTLFLATELK